MVAIEMSASSTFSPEVSTTSDDTEFQEQKLRRHFGTCRLPLPLSASGVQAEGNIVCLSGKKAMSAEAQFPRDGAMLPAGGDSWESMRFLVGSGARCGPDSQPTVKVAPVSGAQSPFN